MADQEAEAGTHKRLGRWAWDPTFTFAPSDLFLSFRLCLLWVLQIPQILSTARIQVFEAYAYREYLRLVW